MDKSGTGCREGLPRVLESPCEFDSCPQGSPPTGYNATDHKLNYINSWPATSVQIGIDEIAPAHFNGSKPDLAISGINAGRNTGIINYTSGTVGAAAKAAHMGIPAIAFHGHTGEKQPWTNPTPAYAAVYADLATKLTQTLLRSGPPYLPRFAYLNVNFPKVSQRCARPADFDFVMTRLHHRIPVISKKDIQVCGKKRLPREGHVLHKKGCHVRVSVGDARSMRDFYGAQLVVFEKLRSILSCLKGGSA